MPTTAYAIGEPGMIMLYGCGEQARPWPDLQRHLQERVQQTLPPADPSTLLDRLRQQLAEVRRAIQASRAISPAVTGR